MGAVPYTIGWVHNLEVQPPRSDAQLIIALAIALSSFAFLSVLLRFATKWKILNSIGMDDGSAAAGMLLGVAYSAVAIYQTKWGLGLSHEYSPAENVVMFSKIQYIGGPLYCLAILGFKASLVAGYLRVAGFNRMYARVIYGVLAAVTLNQLIYTFLLCFACRPIRKQWDTSVPGTCINQLATYFALGGSSLGFDLLIIFLPFPIIRRLQLDKKKKILLGLLYGLGLFITIIQAIRVQTIANLVTYTDSQPIIIWSIVEINIGIFISCVPSFAPLLKFFTRKVSRVYSSQTKSRSKKLTGNLSSMNHSGHPHMLQSTSKSRALASGIREEDGPDDDEVALWAARKGIHGWHEANAMPMTVMRDKSSSLEDDDSDHHRRGMHHSPDGRANDILVVREVHITNGNDMN